MSKLHKASLMIAHDEEIGAIYYPAKGAVFATTPHHAQILEQVWRDYISNQLSQADQSALESYVEQAFSNKPDLPMKEYTNLLETHSLGRLEILVANECNLNCRYCYAHGGNYDCETQILTPELAKKYLSALFPNQYTSVDVVMLFGGEPTIAPHTIQTICEFFEQSSSSGIIKKMPIFTMVTNGTLIDEDLAQTLQKYEVRITVSADGPPEINDALRVDKGGNGTFAKIERGIQLLQKAGNPPRMIESTYTTLHRQMGFSKDDIRQYLRDRFHVNDVAVSDCEPNGYDDSLVYYSKEFYVDDEFHDLSSSLMLLRRKLARKEFCDVHCGAGIQAAALMPNGELYPCHQFVGQSDYRIARFTESGFDFNNYSSILSGFSVAHKCKNPRCSDCWAKALCCACPAMILIPSKAMSIDDDACQFEKTRQTQLILALAKETIKEN